MKTITTLLGMLLTASAFAQAPASAPSGSTGLCKDGTYSSAASKRGACAGHKGVKDWFAASAAAPTSTPAAPPAAKAGAPVPPTTPATTPAPATPATATATPSPVVRAPARPAITTPAAGGGNGQVWVNTASNVYHCAGDRYYGKTKAGQYMTEAAAKQAGARPDHGKACS